MSLHTFFAYDLDRSWIGSRLPPFSWTCAMSSRLTCAIVKISKLRKMSSRCTIICLKTTNDRFQTDECVFYASDADSSCFHLFEIDQRSVHRRPSSVRNRTLINFKQINQHDTYFRHFLSHRPQQKLNISSTFLETFLTNRRAQRGHFSNRFIDFSSEFFKKSARAARKIF